METTLDPAALVFAAETCASAVDAIVPILRRFGSAALGFAARSGIRIVALGTSEHYLNRSASLRRLGVDVDAWPVPPAGLFVVEEKAVYLRSTSPMTVAHEFGHALDCALGGGVYRSSYDAALRSAFARAGEFVTPYAATGVDEYLAEALRAYVEVNDPHSPWPRVSRARLAGVDPTLHAYVAGLFGHELR